MQYDQPLPSIRKLKKLAEWDGPFPMKSYRLIISADRYGFDDDIIWFLKLFPHDEVFQTRSDFLEHCKTLTASIQARRKTSV